MGGRQTFQVVLEKDETANATHVAVPFDVEKVFGAKRVPVKIWICGVERRTTIFRMGGKYLVPVPRSFREEAGVAAGETIAVTMERDSDERTVEVPEDLAAALAEAGLTEVFAGMSYTHRKEYARAVAEARKEETRARRVQQAVEEISKKKK